MGFSAEGESCRHLTVDFKACHVQRLQISTDRDNARQGGLNLLVVPILRQGNVFHALQSVLEVACIVSDNNVAIRTIGEVFVLYISDEACDTYWRQERATRGISYRFHSHLSSPGFVLR